MIDARKVIEGVKLIVRFVVQAAWIFPHIGQPSQAIGAGTALLAGFILSGRAVVRVGDGAEAAVQAFADYPEAGVIYGDAWFIAEDGSRTAPYPVEPFEASNLERRCFICQCSCMSRANLSVSPCSSASLMRNPRSFT